MNCLQSLQSAESNAELQDQTEEHFAAKNVFWFGPFELGLSFEKHTSFAVKRESEFFKVQDEFENKSVTDAITIYTCQYII